MAETSFVSHSEAITTAILTSIHFYSTVQPNICLCYGIIVATIPSIGSSLVS
jgi:hypothetical protein